MNISLIEYYILFNIFELGEIMSTHCNLDYLYKKLLQDRFISEREYRKVVIMERKFGMIYKYIYGQWWAAVQPFSSKHFGI